MNIIRYRIGLKKPHKKPAIEFLYLSIIFRLLNAYIRVIFCTLIFLLILYTGILL